MDFVGSYGQLLEQGRLTRLPRRRRRSGNGATEGEEMEEDGEREVLMGKLWENYRKTIGNIWENLSNMENCGQIWQNSGQNWTLHLVELHDLHIKHGDFR